MAITAISSQGTELVLPTFSISTPGKTATLRLTFPTYFSPVTVVCGYRIRNGQVIFNCSGGDVVSRIEYTINDQTVTGKSQLKHF